ncbi:unnamed protein product [marine sediment metagenome]|uniref:Type II secretion system protein GspF domain-containing protein n=1 Tax=marine sediment metagenome TaxID=412755 RepID=X1HBV6_9ZZZZ
MDKAVAVMGKGLRMPALVAAADRISARLGKGIDPADAMVEEKMFPAGILWAIAIAETSGDFPNTLVKTGLAYRELAGAFLTRFTAVTNLFLLLILFAIIAILVISMYLPMFSMAQLI